MLKKFHQARYIEDSSTKSKPIFALLVALIVLSPIGLLATGNAWSEWGAGEISSVISGGKPLGFVPKGMQERIQL